jgi:hypothetical protein
VRLLAVALTLRELFAHYALSDDRWSQLLRWLAVAPLVHRTVRWHTDSYSGAALLKPEGGKFEVVRT